MSDQLYFARRETDARASAAAATNENARQSHLLLVELYRAEQVRLEQDEQDEVAREARLGKVIAA